MNAIVCQITGSSIGFEVVKGGDYILEYDAM
jgi:hypothetical protein